ncbi:acyltransferase [Cenarchaeum symbiosum A]|uniref:Acyltransferase n=1 Tax=Cenarchaeum symbiosum (strain A) TaxID=414004 RepID=A0RX82_CENSY|nr:acyltransferase [Cenarchaeum symbiosum A]
MAERFATVGGSRIRYLDSGGAGEILLLLHGLGASAERWEFASPALEEKYRVVAPDLPGFGQSDKPFADYTPGFFAGAVEGLLGEIGIGRAHVMGSSLGGQVAIELAAKNPRTVDKLVLVSSSGIMKSSTPALDEYVMTALYPNKWMAMEIFARMSASGTADEAIVDGFIERMRLPNARMAFLSSILGLKNAPVVTPLLNAIDSPSLVIWGSLDPVIPIEHAEGFVSGIRNCAFHRMEGSGHTPFVDHPSEFAKIVLGFLAE